MKKGNEKRKTKAENYSVKEAVRGLKEKIKESKR